MYPKKQSFERNKVIVDTPVYKLHTFHGDKASGAPVFVVGPHAGRHVNIVQRLCDTCVQQGRPVYAYELKSANEENKSTTIEDLVRILHTCVIHIGEPVELIGVCQGAWLGGLFIARFPMLATKYANFVGPINTKTGQKNSVEEYMKKPGVIKFHREKFEANGGIQLGSDQWFAFSMLDPWETYVGRFLTQQQNLFFGLFNDKTEAIEKWEKNESWYDESHDLGAWFMEAMEWHFGDNRIYNGAMPQILGEDVNLKNITCPVFLFGGGTDLITHWQQVLDMQKVVGSKEIYTHVFPDAGHTKAFVGTEELNHFVKVFFK
jgi:poly(3-hydroxyalkanoate) synthetase